MPFDRLHDLIGRIPEQHIHFVQRTRNHGQEDLPQARGIIDGRGVRRELLALWGSV